MPLMRFWKSICETSGAKETMKNISHEEELQVKARGPKMAQKTPNRLRSVQLIHPNCTAVLWPNMPMHRCGKEERRGGESNGVCVNW